MSAGGSGAPTPSAEAAAREKLEQIIRACFLKTVEVILHARIVPYSADLRRGKINRTVCARPALRARVAGPLLQLTHVQHMRASPPLACPRLTRPRPVRMCRRLLRTRAAFLCPRSSSLADLSGRQFNIELDELEAVRRELNHWDPHRPLPLFIDILLDLDSGSAVAAAQRALNEPSPEQQARGQARAGLESVVLLERWQVLYLPSTQRCARTHAQGPTAALWCPLRSPPAPPVLLGGTCLHAVADAAGL